MRRLTVISLLASLAFAAPHGAQASPYAHRLAETTIPKIRVWVTVYKEQFANLRKIVASGWMSAGNPFYIHFAMAYSDVYVIRAQVHADASATSPIADTTAALHNQTGVAIYLRKNGHGYYWEY
jgi:hypothetical protein